MERFEKDVQQMFALRVMVNAAEMLGLTKGVAFVSVQKKRDAEYNQEVRFLVVNNTIQREPSSLIKDDTGTNYFAVAMSKLAVMMGSNGRNSGYPELRPKNGEVVYRGGLVREVGEFFIYTGFSGGTEDEDVGIADMGMGILLAGDAKGRK